MSSRVRTRHGEVEGRQRGSVHGFLGLPFAQPPVGALRWRPPVPPVPWDGVRMATGFGPASPQIIPPMFKLRTTEQSEDCLYLNVWTSELGHEARQPVMVWIHGGGYLGGAGSEAGYDGARLAAHGVTVVTVNYRLGAFGLAAHPAIGANFAILDHIAALTWVAENIAAFGGDPANVTVFGQSAGAVSVRSLLAAPKAQGLFHRTIMQSGGGEPIAAVADLQGAPRAYAATTDMFDRLGGADLDALRAVPAERIVELSRELSGANPPPGQVHTPANLVWLPVADNEVLSTIDSPGASVDLPILIGCTANEARYFMKPGNDYPDMIVPGMTRALAGSRADDVITYLRSLGLPTYETLDLLFTTAVFVEPMLAAVRRFSALGHPVYIYRFERVSPGARRSHDLARHTSEIRYVFGNLDPADDYEPTDRAISDAMQAAWIAFARTGVAGDTATWPRYSPATPEHTMIGDAVTAAALTPEHLAELIAAQR